MTEFPCKRKEVVLSLLISTSRSLLVQFWPGMPSFFSSLPNLSLQGLMKPCLYSPDSTAHSELLGTPGQPTPLDLVTGSLREGRQ